MKVYNYYIQKTPSSGAVSWNTPTLPDGELVDLNVRPTTSTTTWQLTITGPNTMKMYDSEDAFTGEQHRLGFACIGLVKGVYTIAISSASQDEIFHVQLSIKMYELSR